MYDVCAKHLFDQWKLCDYDKQNGFYCTQEASKVVQLQNVT